MNNTTLLSNTTTILLNKTWLAMTKNSASIALCICIFGIIVNSFVVCIIIKSKNFQTSTYIFIASMSSANVITLLSVTINAILLLMLSDTMDYSVFLNTTCKISKYMLEIGFCISTESLAIISVDRYYSMCIHHTPSSKLTFKRWYEIKRALIVSWIYPLIASIPSLFFSSMRTTPPYLCDISQKALEYDAIYKLIFYSFNYILPSIIVTIMYIKITLYLRLKVKHLPNQGNTFKNSRKRIIKVIYMMLIVTTTYMLIALPNVIFVYIAAANKVSVGILLYFGNPKLKVFITVAVYLAQLSWLYNATFYLIYNKSFRKEMIYILRCRLSRKHGR